MKKFEIIGCPSLADFCQSLVGAATPLGQLTNVEAQATVLLILRVVDESLAEKREVRGTIVGLNHARATSIGWEVAMGELNYSANDTFQFMLWGCSEGFQGQFAGLYDFKKREGMLFSPLPTNKVG